MCRIKTLSKKMKKILIIEDDSSIAELERDYLEINDFECAIAARGTTGLEKALAENFDLIIIDIMLPGMDGFEVITELRKKKQTPVIFLSAKNTDIDKIRGLGLGADDYMTKPFSLSVLLLKIEAHFRRRKNEPGTPKIHSKDIVFIPGEMRAFVKEREISLTKNELKMLSFFLQNPKQILSKTQLLENVFDLDGDFMDENTVAVNIRRLREKIEEDPAAPVYIKNIRGLGYIWNQEVSQ